MRNQKLSKIIKLGILTGLLGAIIGGCIATYNPGYYSFEFGTSLGFIQGFFWSSSIYAILTWHEEIKQFFIKRKITKIKLLFSFVNISFALLDKLLAKVSFI